MNIAELREDALRGFGPQVGDVGALFDGADEGFEHQVEGARLGEGARFVGVGADEAVVVFNRNVEQGNGFVVGDIALGDFLNLFLGRSGDFFVEGEHQGGGVRLVFEDENLIGAVAAFGLAAIDHRILEVTDVAGGFPYFRVHDDRAVEADHVFAGLDNGFPPALFDVALQLDAERAVVPEAVDAAVDFRGLENKAAAFAE